MRLDANERTHLFLLAQQQAPPALLLETEIVSPALQYFLDQFDTRPAFVSGRRWDILAWNDAGCAVFGDFRLMTTPRERNTIWGIFTNPLARQYIVDWEEDARQILAQFRSSCGRYHRTPVPHHKISPLCHPDRNKPTVGADLSAEMDPGTRHLASLYTLYPPACIVVTTLAVVMPQGRATGLSPARHSLSQSPDPS